MAQLRSRNPDPPCISSLYNEQCLPKFQEACSLLEQPDGDLAFRKSLPILLDEVGRLRAWAGNSGARREPRHKLSLDYRLREASHLHLGFTELLGDLNQNLEDGKTPDMSGYIIIYTIFNTNGKQHLRYCPGKERRNLRR